MIDLTVNLNDGATIEINNLSKGGVQEILDAAKLIYPTWSSLVIVLVRPAKEVTHA